MDLLDKHFPVSFSDKYILKNSVHCFWQVGPFHNKKNSVTPQTARQGRSCLGPEILSLNQLSPVSCYCYFSVFPRYKKEDKVSYFQYVSICVCVCVYVERDRDTYMR